jgi:hypothetical protein
MVEYRNQFRACTFPSSAILVGCNALVDQGSHSLGLAEVAPHILPFVFHYRLFVLDSCPCLLPVGRSSSYGYPYHSQVCDEDIPAQIRQLFSKLARQRAVNWHDYICAHTDRQNSNESILSPQPLLKPVAGSLDPYG